jgi:hypothetical protein
VLVLAPAVRHNKSRKIIRAACKATSSLGKTNFVCCREGLVSVRGVLHVHSAPPALCPHIEWAVAGVLGVPVNMPWVDQAASPGALRAELLWQGNPGAGAAITSSLAGWNLVRFEITEDASPGCDAVRYCHTPTLGTFSAVVAANGDIVIPEGRLRAAMTLAASAKVATAEAASAEAASAEAAARGGADSSHPRLGGLQDLHGPRHPALGGSLEAELWLLLGQPWDDELEPFRRAGDGAPVRWLNATG